MNDRLEVLKFASEEEEANWWFESRAKLEEEFLEAARTGRLRSGSTALRRAREASNALTIHLSDSDLAATCHLASHRGQETETPDHGVDRQ
jgi:hypothetical protein